MSVTQPTMSGMLQRLRYQFNDQLLVRNGRQMELTPFAASLVDPVRDAICGIDQLMRAEPVFDPKLSNREFRVMTSDYCISVFLTFVIERIIQEAPGIRLFMQPIVDPMEDLVSGTIDICISPADLSGFGKDYNHEKLQSEHLFSDSFVGIVHEKHAISDTPNLEEFLSFPHVGVEIPGAIGTIDAVSLRQFAPDYRPSFVVPEYSLISPIVSTTDAIGMVQSRLADGLRAASPIRVIHLPCTIPSIDERMLWHTRHMEDPAHIWLRGILREVAAARL